MARELQVLNIMEDRIEEEWAEDSEGNHFRFNFSTQKWDFQLHCGLCGKSKCECVDRSIVLQTAEAGGGEEIKYVFVVVL